MIIDSHAHVVLPNERQIEWMEEAQIDKTVLFTSVVHPEKASSLMEFKKEMGMLYDIINGIKNPIEERLKAIEELKSAIKENPQRYIGFGSIPTGLSYEENLSWIEKYIVKNSFYGIGELTPNSGQVELLEPLFQASRSTGNLPLWVHTFFPLVTQDIKILLDLAKRYPSVSLILGHMGGIHWLDTLVACKDLSNVYIDLSATFTTLALEFAIREFPERVLFSSDAPYTSPLSAKINIETLIKDKGLCQQVLGGNIANLLQIC
ncbi:amidohydrolase family protein [Propionispira raffinosivorans]|uniref:amidohydrolase family protein n=1 Tax=Propionispira raffinosivorans TaxID=86959 RepID=UPI0003613AB1|nr:amidohydrolase family protein [Propionispira raffinosivorans]